MATAHLDRMRFYLRSTARGCVTSIHFCRSNDTSTAPTGFTPPKLAHRVAVPITPNRTLDNFKPATLPVNDGISY